MCWQWVLQSVFVVSKLYEWAEKLTFDLYDNKSNSVTLSVFSYETFVWNLFIFGILILEFCPKMFFMRSQRSLTERWMWFSRASGAVSLEWRTFYIMVLNSDYPVVLELMLSCWRFLVTLNFSNFSFLFFCSLNVQAMSFSHCPLS